MEKVIASNGLQKKEGVAILVSNEIDVKSKVVKRNKESYYIMIKESIFQKEITILNMYMPNSRIPEYI
jgi:exonuclease III